MRKWMDGCRESKTEIKFNSKQTHRRIAQLTQQPSLKWICNLITQVQSNIRTQIERDGKIVIFNLDETNCYYIEIIIRFLHIFVRACSAQYFPSSSFAKGDSGTAHSMFEAAGTQKTVRAEVPYDLFFPLSCFPICPVLDRKFVPSSRIPLG